MPKGVKISEMSIGTGAEAVRGKIVTVDVRLFLNRGEEITSTVMGGTRMRIDLGRRECIAGLRYGVEGMRVGGKRELTISPHLAYRDEGVIGCIPPNAVIRAEVELLDVYERGEYRPEDYPPGKHVFVFRPGEAARNLPRWQFGLQEDGRCGVMITHPIPGMPWRRNRASTQEAMLDDEMSRAFIDEVLDMPEAYPGDCLPNEDLWADHAEKGNAITRDRETDTLCFTMGVIECGKWIVYYSLPETSRAVADSRLLAWIGEWIHTDSD